MASQSNFCRSLKRSSLEDNEEIMYRFNRRWFEMVDIEKDTLYFDSSLISRLGDQEVVVQSGITRSDMAELLIIY
jgi:hypothetical protein